MSWPDEQTNYLIKYWGILTIPTLANNLNKSINAVKLKAGRLGLGCHLHADQSYITLNKLCQALR